MKLMDWSSEQIEFPNSQGTQRRRTSWSFITTWNTLGYCDKIQASHFNTFIRNHICRNMATVSKVVWSPKNF